MSEVEQTLVDNGDGTITDTKTGLMWQKGDAGPMRWEKAVETCQALSLASKTDWRPPTLKELNGLFRSLHHDEHVLDRRLEPFEWSSDRYWTGEVVEPYFAAFLVNFNGGSHPWEPRNMQYYIRAVRGSSDQKK
jgi:hypothetical protein